MRLHDYISAIVVKHTSKIENKDRLDARRLILDHAQFNGEIAHNEIFGVGWEKRQFRMKRGPETIKGIDMMVETFSAIYKSREATLTLQTINDLPIDRALPGRQRVLAAITAHHAIPHSIINAVEPALGQFIELPPEIKLIDFAVLNEPVFTCKPDSTHIMGVIESKDLTPGEQPNYTTKLPDLYLDLRQSIYPPRDFSIAKLFGLET